MRISVFSHQALGLGLAIAFLAGCGGGSQAGGTGAVPQGAMAQALHKASGSSGDLIYVAGAPKSYVLSYASGKVVGTMSAPASGACADSSGDVYLTDISGIAEFEHGATSPVRTFGLSGEAFGCSVDPTTGNLAVTVIGYRRYNVAIFKNASGLPITYHLSSLDPFYCGYDADGDLFVDGSAGHGTTALSELPV
jgi:hypothetical protein